MMHNRSDLVFETQCGGIEFVVEPAATFSVDPREVGIRALYHVVQIDCRKSLARAKFTGLLDQRRGERHH